MPPHPNPSPRGEGQVEPACTNGTRDGLLWFWVTEVGFCFLLLAILFSLVALAISPFQGFVSFTLICSQPWQAGLVLAAFQAFALPHCYSIPRLGAWANYDAPSGLFFPFMIFAFRSSQVNYTLSPSRHTRCKPCLSFSKAYREKNVAG